MKLITKEKIKRTISRGLALLVILGNIIEPSSVLITNAETKDGLGGPPEPPQVHSGPIHVPQAGGESIGNHTQHGWGPGPDPINLGHIDTRNGYKGWVRNYSGWAHCPDDDDGDDSCYPVIPTNPRQERWLTVATMTNMANYGKYDYRLPSSKWREIIQRAEEFNTADIIEYNYFTDSKASQAGVSDEDVTKLERRPFQVNIDINKDMSTEKSEKYRQQMNYLISNNIINRDEVYNIESIIYATSRDYRPNTRTGILLRGERNFTRPTERYSKLTGLYAKSDFLADLSKTQSVLMSRPLLVRMQYSRGTAGVQVETVSTEPIDASPYRKYMGELGIDSVQNDIWIDHTVYGETALLATNDVTEKYLKRLLEQGVITKDELMIAETVDETKIYADKILEAMSPTMSDKPIGGEDLFNQENSTVAWELTEPVRINYNKTAMTKYEDIVKHLHGGRSISDTSSMITGKKGTWIWGSTYDYSKLRQGGKINPEDFAQIFNDKKGQIIKKNNYIHDPNGNGYRFFKEEKINLLDAYKLVYRFLKITEDELKLSEEDVDAINSAYSLNLSSYTPEEREAIQYLLAKGIIDGDSQELATASSTPLSNYNGIDLIYRVMNKDYRKTAIPNLSETDKEMWKKGFSQAKITNLKGKQALPTPTSISLGETGLTEEEITKTVKDLELSRPIKDATAVDIDYDYIYIRLPGVFKDENNVEGLAAVLKLITKDSSREIIAPSKYIQNELSEETNPTVWAMYKVHKTVSNNLFLQGHDNAQIYGYEGIVGAGVYILSDSTPNATIAKFPLSKVGIDNKFTQLIGNSLSNQIQQDLNEREKSFIKEVNKKRSTSNIKQDKALKLIMAKLFKDDIEVSTKLANPGLYIANNDENLTPEQKKEKDKNLKVVTMAGIDKSKLELIEFKGQLLFSKGNGPLGYTINEDVLTDEFKGKLKIVEDPNTKKVNLLYTPKEGPNPISFAKLSKSIRIPSSDNKENVIPGYAKFLSNGKPVVVIAKDELKKYDIVALSDKTLFNDKTGQYAFINTDDSMSLIGNNITHYPEGYMMVNTFGGEGKEYYNLEIVAELINDTVAIESNSGKDIFMSIPGEVFHQTPIMDISAEDATSGQAVHLQTDKTYTLEVKNADGKGTGTRYMSLSALVGNASNMLYYKNKIASKEVSALIVYRPNTKDSIVKSEKGKVDNTLKNFVKGIDIPNTVVEKDSQRDIKNKILASLFKGSDEKDKDGDLIGGNYLYDIYVLSDGSPERQEVALTNLLNAISGKGKDLNKLKTAVSIEGFGNKDSKNDSADIRILPMKSSAKAGENLWEHKQSGNIYVLLTSIKEGKPTQNTKFIKDLTYQNFAFADKPERIIFRRYRFFENTPEKMIPLEVYGTDPQEYGRLERGDNKAVGNFTPDKVNKNYKLPYYNFGNNNAILKKTESKKKVIGMGTKLELPYQKIKDEDLKEIIKATSNQQVVDKLYDITVKAFKEDKSMGAYKDNIEKALTNVEVGWDKSRPVEDKIQLMQGTWDGIFDSYDYYALGNPDRVQITPDPAKKATLIFTMGRKYHKDMKKEYLDTVNLMGLNIIEQKEKTDKNGNKICVQDKTKQPTNKGYPCKVDAQGNVIYEMVGAGASLVQKADGSSSLISPLPKKGSEPVIYEALAQLGVKTVGDDLLKEIDIYFKPTLVIPTGTTLVNTEGELVYLPAKHTRNEVFYNADIVNALVSRIHDKDKDGKKALYLSDIPENSLVQLPEGSYFVKQSPAQTMGNGVVSWVPSLVLPKSRENSANIDTYALFYNFIRDFGNIKIAYRNGSNSIYLKQIVGKNLFRLPTEKDVINVGKNLAVLEALKEKVPLMVETEENEESFTASPLYIRSLTETKVLETDQLSYVGYKVFMPPTLEVEKIINPNDPKAEIYKVIRYHDISKFQVDKDSSYVKYLKSKDTPAEEINMFVENLQSSDLKALDYITSFFSETFNTSSIETTETLFNWIIPIICIFMISYVTIMFVLLLTEWGKSLIDTIYMKTGISLIFGIPKVWVYDRPRLGQLILELLVIGFVWASFQSKTVLYVIYKIFAAVV